MAAQQTNLDRVPKGIDDVQTRSSPFQSPAKWVLVVALATAMLCLPFVRNVEWLGDEGIWLSAADRLLGGDRL